MEATDDIYARTVMLIGEDGLKKLRSSHVLIVGIGGVGAFAAEALARSGIGKITMVDHDQIDRTNINRQLHALHSTIGRDKVDVMAERIADIDPTIQVIKKKEFLTPDNITTVLQDSYDYVVDAIDYVPTKIELVVWSQKVGIPILCAMGTGNKLDNTAFRFADISKTQQCPLARTMRQQLRKRGIEKGVEVLYAPIPAIKPLNSPQGEEKRAPGSIAFVPSVGGLLIAGKVVNELLNKKDKKNL